MSIKVGQIYGYVDDYTQIEYRICVTCVLRFTAFGISSSGVTYDKGKSFYEDLPLIAEYPTWQEAVNSVEFKGEEKNAE